MPKKRKPFIGQIRRDKTWPGMDEDAADPVRPEIGKLFLDLFLCDPIIPDPERGAAVLRGRVLECPEDGGIGIRRGRAWTFLPDQKKGRDQNQKKQKDDLFSHGDTPLLRKIIELHRSIISDLIRQMFHNAFKTFNLLY
jgi:hypothetical protein